MNTSTVYTVTMALRGDEPAAEIVKHRMQQSGFIEIGSWSPYQRDVYKLDQVITLAGLRFKHRAAGIQLLKPTDDSNPLRSDPTFKALDTQFHTIWAELQWEAADGGNWLWTDAERALLYQYITSNDQLSEIDRLKVELWKLLGGFETQQPPSLLTA